MVVCHVPLDRRFALASLRHWRTILEVERSAWRESVAVIAAVEVTFATIRNFSL